MPDHPNVAIFWDYENCSPPSVSSGLGYDIVNNVGRIARLFGSVTTFRAYLDVSAQSPKSVVLRSELQSSGVSMIDCPHNGKKDVVDKMMLVDMLAFAIDHPSPATVILITGDRDYAYAVSILKLRKYQVILIVPSSLHSSACLESQASLVIDWSTAVLGSRTDPANSTQPVRQPCFDLDATLVAKLLKELQESPDDLDAAPRSASRLRRVTPRDLLEPSRHSKNAKSFDSAQEFALDPASPKKSATAGLPIPKTPSRSRHASVSTASTRARSTTIVAQCPPLVEPCTPAKNPPPSTESVSSTFDVAGAANVVQRSSPVLASLGMLGLSLLDNCPPSPILIRSPLEPTRSTYDAPRVSGETCVPSSQMLASPFIQPTGLQSAPDRQSNTTFESTSPSVGPTKILTAVCSTPRTRNVGVPNLEEIEHLRFENKGVCEQSLPHQSHPDEACCAANLTMLNYDSCVASRTTHSLSNGSVGTGNPASKHVLPCAASLPGAGEGDNLAQFGTPLYISNARDHVVSATSLGASLSAPSATTETHEHDDEPKRCQAWIAFKPLIHLLLAAREQGVARPSRSTIAVDLISSDDQVYKRAGASRFRDYTALAEKSGVIELGGKEGDAWIALHPDWFGVDGSTATQSVSDRVSSAMLASPTASSSTGPETPLIERAAIFRTPTPDASPTLTSDGQDRAPRMPIPAPFQPLIDALVHIRAEGTCHPRRSIVGQMLNQAVYSRAGMSGFKEYIRRASEAQLVQLGGSGGHAWIGLYPELQC